jgi:ornithine decarboxylase
MRAIIALGVNPDKCIYANPVKQIDHLQVAKSLGIMKITFDCIEELQKIKTHFR